MKKFILVLCLSSISAYCFGQFGITTKYSFNNYNHWSDVTESINDSRLFENHLEFALDYRFRPGEKRIELFMEASYLNNSTSMISPGGNDRVFSMNGFGLGLKANVYFLDFHGDCDCPTFGKEGGFLKKGLFLQFSTAASYWNKKAEFFSDPTDSSLLVDIGVGIGLDIGISNMITVTPIASVNYYPFATWEQFAIEQGLLDQSNPNSRTTISMFKLGVRIGLHPDFIKERRVLNRRR